MKSVLLFLAFAACAASTKPTPVAIVNPVVIKLERVSADVMACWLNDLAVVPDEVRIPYEEEDVIQRTFVHTRDYNELVVWARGMNAWLVGFKKCVEQLVQP